ncbi:MAG TPA: Na/Pi cotransporter, partial [Flavobacteriales bacterium]|nr:Na/Pi cotransporter [Flavobacteriales bacterium]
MNFGFVDLLQLVGALGFFIYGMKVMSDGIQKVAGSKMRDILSAMTSNRFLGLITGFLVTALLQSSSATTVMIVSFVNAGLLSLVESIGVIMGANIGTTITAWLISILGFKVKISALALPIIAVGFPMLFSSRSKWNSWAQVLIGFALLFMGLDELKHAVPDLKS